MIWSCEVQRSRKELKVQINDHPQGIVGLLFHCEMEGFLTGFELSPFTMAMTEKHTAQTKLQCLQDNIWPEPRPESLQIHGKTWWKSRCANLVGSDPQRLDAVSIACVVSTESWNKGPGVYIQKFKTQKCEKKTNPKPLNMQVQLVAYLLFVLGFRSPAVRHLTCTSKETARPSSVAMRGSTSWAEQWSSKWVEASSSGL